jgi:hypothetical protein
VCGFLAPDSREEQVVGNHCYSNFTIAAFHCGSFRSLQEIDSAARARAEAEGELEVFLASDAVAEDPFLTNDPTCGATLINDRWAVTAAHCYVKYNAFTEEARQVKVKSIRVNTTFTELVEVKRVYKHPLYRFPMQYNDVAVMELGRRVEYNFEKFGDSPSCIDQGHSASEWGVIMTISF